MPAADVPLIMYGTAWKEESTAACVQTALAAGFRAIDTANQRKHYDEAGVGAALASSSIPRAELFLQSKFTYQRGQDHRLPYDPRAPLATQVAQSVASSLAHLGVTYLDSLVLHGPAEAAGITDDDRQVWAAMEAEVDAGRVRLLGVSNVSAAQYVQLADDARVAPRVVQNRCYASRGWDRATREACNARGAVYQGFSLLTANRDVWHGATVGRNRAAPGGHASPGHLRVRARGRHAAAHRLARPGAPGRGPRGARPAADRRRRRGDQRDNGLIALSRARRRASRRPGAPDRAGPRARSTAPRRVPGPGRWAPRNGCSRPAP